jgi:hypothetical protein
VHLIMVSDTLPSQWFLAPARLYPLLETAQIPAVSSKEGAVVVPLHDSHLYFVLHWNIIMLILYNITL